MSSLLLKPLSVFPIRKRHLHFYSYSSQNTGAIFFLSLPISNSSVNYVGSVLKNTSRSISKSVSHFYGTPLILGSPIPYLDYSNTLLTYLLASVLAPAKSTLYARVILSKPDIRLCLRLHKIFLSPLRVNSRSLPQSLPSSLNSSLQFPYSLYSSHSSLFPGS